MALNAELGSPGWSENHPRDTDAGRSLSRAVGAACWTLGVALSASVAVSQILLGAAALAAGAALWRGAARPRPPAGSRMLALFAAGCLLSALLGGTPLTSLWELKELLLLGVPLLGVWLLRGEREVELAGAGALWAGALLALWGIAQFLRGLPDPYERIRGPLSHHLSYAGLVMLLLVAGAAWSASRLPILRRSALATLPPLAAALLLNQSRSAWLGAAAGLLALIATGPRRAALGLLLAASLAVLLHPELRLRAASVTAPQADTSLRARRAMLATGLRIVAESPWFGAGPGRIGQAYSRLQPPEYPLPVVQHLHCTPLQIAAERGLLALALWIGFWVALGRGLWLLPGEAAGGARPELRASAAAAAAAFLAMGLFEYNFGDAEPSTLLLGLLALPFVRPAGV